MLRIPPHADLHGGVFLCRHALALGYDHDCIARAVKRREWRRLRRGAFTSQHRWDAADARARHLLMTHAVAQQVGPQSVVSHASSAVALGLPLQGVALSEVHVTRPYGTSRRSAGVAHHSASLDGADIVAAADLLVLSPARTSLDLAREWGRAAGMVAADAVLRTTTVTPQQLRDAAEQMADWPGGRDAAFVASEADARSETPGESLSRLVCLELGYPLVLQVEIEDGLGQVIARVDGLLFEEDVIVEFDGAVKYATDGDAGSALFAEKKREDRLRELGFEFVRLTWGDLPLTQLVDRKIRRAIERSRERRAARRRGR